jgi:Mrp family chromosome partitioning ATPase
VLAAFLGLVLAAVAVIVLARTDKRLRREEDVEALTGSPALAVIPIDTEAGPQARDALAGVAVRMALRPGRPRCVLVTSAAAGEGAAEVTLGLARALAELGRRVIAVEAELREPSFARLMGVLEGDGLSALLTGRCPLDRVIVDLGPASPGAEIVSVLPAGAPVETPGALLAGAPMSTLLEQAAGLADVVLVAAGPVAGPGDALTLVKHVDHVIVVARLDVTRREDLTRAVAALAELDARPLGTVLVTGAPRRHGPRAAAVQPSIADGHAVPREGAGPRAASSNGFHAHDEDTTEVTK